MPHGPTPAVSPWDTTTTAHSALYALAREFVLADNFFQGAFGGSFLNHQYLICACAPEYPECGHGGGEALDRDTRQGRGRPLSAAAQDGERLHRASALDEPPKFAKSGNITPANYFGDGKFYAVNTMQPPYQPSGNKPAAARCRAFSTPIPTMPPRCRRRRQATIGDALDAKHVDWTWYSGAWDAALADGRRPAARSARGDLRAGDSRRQSRFPAASPAVQLLRALRSARPRRRSAPRT